MYIYTKSHLINNGASSCSIFLFYRIKYVFLINLKYITVTWLFQVQNLNGLFLTVLL